MHRVKINLIFRIIIIALPAIIVGITIYSNREGIKEKFNIDKRKKTAVMSAREDSLLNHERELLIKIEKLEKGRVKDIESIQRLFLELNKLRQEISKSTISQKKRPVRKVDLDVYKQYIQDESSYDSDLSKKVLEPDFAGVDIEVIQPTIKEKPKPTQIDSNRIKYLKRNINWEKKWKIN